MDNGSVEQRTLVVKAHPHATPFAFLTSRPHSIPSPAQTSSELQPTDLVAFLVKCGVWRPSRAIILDRAPLDASEIRHQNQTHSHVQMQSARYWTLARSEDAYRTLSVCD